MRKQYGPSSFQTKSEPGSTKRLLVLRKDTVRVLSEIELQHVPGGGGDSIITNNNNHGSCDPA